jgi:hypothetical protein
VWGFMLLQWYSWGLCSSGMWCCVIADRCPSFLVSALVSLSRVKKPRKTFWDFRLLLPCRQGLHISGLLCNILWQLFTDVLPQPIGPILAVPCSLRMVTWCCWCFFSEEVWTPCLNAAEGSHPVNIDIKLCHFLTVSVPSSGDLGWCSG